MRKLLFILLIGWMIPAVAQDRPNKIPGKLIEKKLAFMRERLMLNDAEYKAFAPVMRDYEKQRMDLGHQRRMLIKDLRKENLAKLSDQEVAKHLDGIMRIDEQLFALKKQYYGKLKTILSPRKMLALIRADMEFKKMLIKRHRQHRPNHGPGPGHRHPGHGPKGN